jgi:hypothetical protein
MMATWLLVVIAVLGIAVIGSILAAVWVSVILGVVQLVREHRGGAPSGEVGPI